MGRSPCATGRSTAGSRSTIIPLPHKIAQVGGAIAFADQFWFVSDERDIHEDRSPLVRVSGSRTFTVAIDELNSTTLAMSATSICYSVSAPPRYSVGPGERDVIRCLPIPTAKPELPGMAVDEVPKYVSSSPSESTARSA